MTDPIHFRFSGMPASKAAEAAARRRTRTLRAAHPDALHWSIDLDAPLPDGACGEYAAHVQVRLADGGTLRAHGRGPDVLAALRLALNATETGLQAGREGLQARAARWLSSVRARFSQPQGFA